MKIQAGVSAAHVTRTERDRAPSLLSRRDEWTKIILFRRWDVRNVLVSSVFRGVASTWKGGEGGKDEERE